MSIELAMLAASGVLSLLLALVVIAVHFRRFGGTMIRSNREHYPELTGLAGRAVRAHANLNEALLPFAIAVIAVLASHATSRWSADAAITFLAARIAHAGLYLAGIPEIRSIAFYIGLAATLVVFAQLPLGIA
ncbi:MAG: MAPEG family protein [Sphingomonas sp.]